MGSDLIAKPVPAATVMCLRDGDDGMEVFMIVRHEKSDVHAGALVFPGGRVDPEDYELAVDAAGAPGEDGGGGVVPGRGRRGSGHGDIAGGRRARDVRGMRRAARARTR